MTYCVTLTPGVEILRALRFFRHPSPYVFNVICHVSSLTYDIKVKSCHMSAMTYEVRWHTPKAAETQLLWIVFRTSGHIVFVSYVMCHRWHMTCFAIICHMSAMTYDQYGWLWNRNYLSNAAPGSKIAKKFINCPKNEKWKNKNFLCILKIFLCKKNGLGATSKTLFLRIFKGTLVFWAPKDQLLSTLHVDP